MIMLPAMLASWGFGLWLAAISGAWTQGWLHAKLALVLVLSGLHGFFAKEARRLAQGGEARAPRFYRIINEVPAAHPRFDRLSRGAEAILSGGAGLAARAISPGTWTSKAPLELAAKETLLVHCGQNVYIWGARPVLRSWILIDRWSLAAPGRISLEAPEAPLRPIFPDSRFASLVPDEASKV